MTSRIYLASKSPRRREILAGLGYEICLLAPEASPASAPQTDEERRPGESARSYVLRTAREKALGAIRMIEEKRLEVLPVVSADTTVVFGETILRKPQSVEEELRFLELLSGKTHVVRTAVAVGTTEENLETVISESRVTFCTMTDSMMKLYAGTDEPYDKAGGYSLPVPHRFCVWCVHPVRRAFITHIEGSYSGIVGLPVFETVELLSHFGRGLESLTAP